MRFLLGISAVIAWISPVCGSIETTAAAGSERSVEVLADRLLGCRLQAAVERRVDREPAGAHGAGAVLGHELVVDVAEEVAVACGDALDVIQPCPWVQPEPELDGAAVLRTAIAPLSSIARRTTFRRARAAPSRSNGS